MPVITQRQTEIESDEFLPRFGEKDATVTQDSLSSHNAPGL